MTKKIAGFKNFGPETFEEFSRHQKKLGHQHAWRRRQGLVSMAEYRARIAAKKTTNAPVRRAKEKTWRQANPERMQALIRGWKRRNPEKVRLAKRKDNSASRRRRRAWLMEAQGGRCAYCREKLGREVHIDHVMPLALGGHNRRSNLQLTCPTCNLSKGATHPVVFAQSLGRLI